VLNSTIDFIEEDLELTDLKKKYATRSSSNSKPNTP